MRTAATSVVATACAVAAAVVVSAGSGEAGAYPTNECVAAKLRGAGKYCDAVFKAWSAWDKTQDDAKRDAKFTKAATKLDEAWDKAEAKAQAAGVDCADTTISASALGLLVGSAAAEIADAINTGLDLGDKEQGKCGSRFLKTVGKKCKAFLKAEAKFVAKLDKDPEGAQRDAYQDAASLRFTTAWNEATVLGCTAGTSAAVVETMVDELSDEVVMNTTVSPNVDDTQFITISPTGTITYSGRNFTPTCMNGSDYHFFAKRGSENKLVMYYQGGGACWEQLTCTVPVCDTSVDPAGGDNPNTWSAGFTDLTNPANPFKDWNIVVVSYCSCDIHFGDAAQDYSNVIPSSPIHVEHRGFHNAKVAEKWAREHFVNPEVVFVTGSSAGSYGALFNAPMLHQVWPASEFRVLGDAGNGVITADFLQNEFENWNFRANLPPDIPGIIEAIDTGTGMVGYIEAVASFFPETSWAHYTTAFDGGSGGQTGFYNVMLHDNNPLAGLTWWEGSCAFNAQMRQQAMDTAAAVALKNDNYRYYIGSGSRHTMWGNNKVYTDTTGGVPTIVDWINEMLEGGPGWVNVEASPFNVLLPGDPRPPTIPTPPFELSGSDVVVNCP